MSKTLENLMAGFAGESQANRKYTAYAEKAEKDGMKNIAKLFRATADAETIHALKEFMLAGHVKTTAENLKDAVAGETYETKIMYPEFEKVAAEEGNVPAEIAFKWAKEAESVHAALYQEALDNIDTYEDQEVTYYLCPICGKIEMSRPDKCSICNADGAKFVEYK